MKQIRVKFWLEELVAREILELYRLEDNTEMQLKKKQILGLLNDTSHNVPLRMKMRYGR